MRTQPRVLSDALSVRWAFQCGGCLQGEDEWGVVGGGGWWVGGWGRRRRDDEIGEGIGTLV